MAIPRAVPAALGAVAFFPTTATLAMHIILARSPADRTQSVRITAAVGAVLEAVIFAALPFLSLSHIAPWAPKPRPRWIRSLWLSAGLVLCPVATAVSVATMISLSRVDDDPQSTIMGRRAGGFLVGASVALGLAFVTQFLFFVCHLVVGRAPPPQIHVSAHPDQESKPVTRIKTVPYHRTSPVPGKERGSKSFDSPTPPGSSGGRSVAETMGSIRSSLSHVIRPISSKTRLLPVSRRSLHQPASLDLQRPHEARTRADDDGFDSWDTSAVGPENRQTVLEPSSPPPPGSRFLEPIPASPAISRSSTPPSEADMLEPPPRTRRRSRSYSPVSTRTIEAQRAAFTQQESLSEAHIHPLFRSDSPVPPPSATPGTVVVAAPDAGRVIADRQSIRSFQSTRRLRSESLPAVPSPLSRAESCESFAHHHPAASVAAAAALVAGSSSTEEIREEDEAAVPGAERNMTPPIPEWILTAGS